RRQIYRVAGSIGRGIVHKVQVAIRTGATRSVVSKHDAQAGLAIIAFSQFARVGGQLILQWWPKHIDRGPANCRSRNRKVERFYACESVPDVSIVETRNVLEGGFLSPCDVAEPARTRRTSLPLSQGAEIARTRALGDADGSVVRGRKRPAVLQVCAN